MKSILWIGQNPAWTPLKYFLAFFAASPTFLGVGFFAALGVVVLAAVLVEDLLGAIGLAVETGFLALGIISFGTSGFAAFFGAAGFSTFAASLEVLEGVFPGALAAGALGLASSLTFLSHKG